ncbi:MAG: hypothetical protein QXI97_06020, partial [Nitrososphaerota archaeon]
PETVERVLWREAYVSYTDDKAWEEVRDGVLYVYGRDYFKWGHLQDDNGREMNPSNTSFEEYVETVRRRFIIRDVIGFIDEVDKYRRELGISHMVLRVFFPGMRHEKARNAIKLIGEKIIPYFHE